MKVESLYLPDCFLLLDRQAHLFWWMSGHAAHPLARANLAWGVLPGKPHPRRGGAPLLPKVREDRRSWKNTPKEVRLNTNEYRERKCNCYAYSAGQLDVQVVMISFHMGLCEMSLIYEWLRGIPMCAIL